MKFYAVKSERELELLTAEYQGGRDVGVAKLGESCFFFRNKRKVYYIPYADMTRIFRRVLSIRATMCCGKGNLEMEHIVICTEEGEAAQIQLPGERAGKILLEELAKKAPQAAIGKE